MLNFPTKTALTPKMNTCAFVRVGFIGFHRWVDAPNEVKYLRDYHRHVFHICLGVSVRHNNRDIEFLTLQQELLAYCNEQFTMKEFDFSCEQIAKLIVDHFIGKGYYPRYCEVSEDNENGSITTIEYIVEEENEDRTNGDHKSL